MEQMPKRLQRKTVYECDELVVYADAVKLPSGKRIENYHQLHYKNQMVCVVIFHGSKILFEHNRRYSIGQMEWELPAGKVELGETPYEACIREAKEETGCTLKNITYLCRFNPENAMTDALVHVYASELDEEDVLTDTDEVSEKRWFSESEYRKLLKNNETLDGVSMLALLYALQFYERKE